MRSAGPEEYHGEASGVGRAFVFRVRCSRAWDFDFLTRGRACSSSGVAVAICYF